MGTIQPTYQPPVRVTETGASRPSGPVSPRDDAGIAPAAQLFLRERHFASRLVEKEALLDAAQQSGTSDPDAVAQQRELADAQTQLEQIKLYSPYPPNESPRAALIRRLSRLQEPPGDPSTLDLGVAMVKADASDDDVDVALDAVKSARAGLKAQAELPAGQAAKARQVRLGRVTPPGEPTSSAVELSQGLRTIFTRQAGMSVSGNARYLRTL